MKPVEKWQNILTTFCARTQFSFTLNTKDVSEVSSGHHFISIKQQYILDQILFIHLVHPFDQKKQVFSMALKPSQRKSKNQIIINVFIVLYCIVISK